MRRALMLLGMLLPMAALADDGQYLARLGDCTACHTAPNGEYMAGGLAFDTPVGKIYSTNITPHPEQGIGKYTYEDFANAMRKGVAREGHALYPAMPYPNYAAITDQDMQSLYQYFMEKVPASATVNKDSDIPWPLSMRWPLKIWNALFLEDAAFKADPSASQSYNRGAYLVQGLAHCGACHTPRGWAMQELGKNESHALFLSGAALDGWYATDLRNHQYSAEELVQLLKTGRSNSHAVSGPMSDVISHSTQYLSDDDAKAIAEYLVAIAQPAPLSTHKPQAQASDKIAGTYMSYCAVCHGREGQGVASVIPALVGNPTVTADDASSLLQVLLNGSHSPRTQQHIGYAMPGYGWTLDDEKLADLANYLRSSWGNQASAVEAGHVAKVRGATRAH